MAHDARGIANLILDFADEEQVKLSNLQLQKVLYFCHAHFLIANGTQLVHGKFQAWEHGPVMRYVYDEFKAHGRNKITNRATKLNHAAGRREIVTVDIRDDYLELLRLVSNFYSRFSASKLRAMSHASGGPWDVVWNNPRGINPGMYIPDELICKLHPSEELN